MCPITWRTCFLFNVYICVYIRSVLRRQSRDTNQNIKLGCCILPLRIVNSHISSVVPLPERKLDFTARIGCTPIFLYFNLYIYRERNAHA